MKKTVNPDAARAAEVGEQLTTLTDAFCNEHLNAEYKRLCRKMIGKLARKRPSPLLRGRADLWAAGVVYALGSANFLFDKNTQPYVSASDLCAAFGAKVSSTGQKATLIRDMFDLGYMGDSEFLIKEIGEHRADLDAMIAQMASLMENTGASPNDFFPVDEEREPTTPTRRGGIFLDGDHPISLRFYDLAERYEQFGASPDIQNGMEQLIQRDPDFYDPYLILAEILDDQDKEAEAEQLRETAYQRALARILDKKGQWPKALDWGWIENRHIIRVFLNKAISLWNARDRDGALDFLRHLLRAAPEDHSGTRFYLLAIRLGLSFDDYEETFATDFGYDAMKLLDWFDDNVDKFPDEFGWWKEAVEEEE